MKYLDKLKELQSIEDGKVEEAIKINPGSGSPGERALARRDVLSPGKGNPHTLRLKAKKRKSFDTSQKRKADEAGKTTYTDSNATERSTKGANLPLKQLKNDWTIYKQIGMTIAEAFAHEIQEAKVKVATARRIMSGGQDRKYSGPKANRLYKQAKQGNQNPNRPKPRLTGDPDTRAGDRVPTQVVTHGKKGSTFVNAKLSKKREHSIYKQIGMTIAEAFVHRPNGFTGPIASKYGDKRSLEGIRDPKVKADAKKAKANLDSRVGRNTKPRAKDMVQASQDANRAASKKRKEGIPTARERMPGSNRYKK